jgi:hypothetical protein
VIKCWQYKKECNKKGFRVLSAKDITVIARESVLERGKARL